MGARPRRFIFTGHSQGAIQMWDLVTMANIFGGNGKYFLFQSTALDFFHKGLATCGEGGPTPLELIRQLEQCELTSSRCSS